MELLRTERMILQPWAERDVAAFFAIYSRDEVARWLGAHPRRPVSDLEDARKRLLGWRKFHDGFEAPYGLWALVPIGHQAPVGTALLLQFRWNRPPRGWFLPGRGGSDAPTPTAPRGSEGFVARRVRTQPPPRP
ncbi:MAG TPA: GNAT family N-acetyltransferase [Actinospica sp.]|nr:GNAT family N-acetyltransferase [Actinospica sp.]